MSESWEPGRVFRGGKWCVLGALWVVLACDALPALKSPAHFCSAPSDCAEGSVCVEGTCLKVPSSERSGESGSADASGRDAAGPCEKGRTRSCFGGEPQHRGQGLCKEGSQTCLDGFWGPCEGSVLPADEVCDGKDNNCNGIIDDIADRDCYSGAPKTRGIGRCKAGTQSCEGGKWGECLGQVLPSAEACGDGIDDNCDGKIDEACTCKDGTTQACGPAVGECAQGKQTCRGSAWGECMGATGPKPEECDGKDNDCNGKIDDALSKTCYSGAASTKDVGICRGGTSTCVAGKWSPCTGEVKPRVEECNGIDDNCDGKVDEQLTQPCYSGPADTLNVGICRGGTRTCVAGKWSPCTGEVKPQKEDCSGKDLDCDGTNGLPSCVCQAGTTRSCGSNDRPPCRKGIQRCQANGQWAPCSGEIKPTAELCNGKDDDCNGQIDDAPSDVGKDCKIPSKQGRCAVGRSACQSGTLICKTAYFSQAETCNGLDDDCDGKVDEDIVISPPTCKVSGQFGLCILGKPSCDSARKKLICKGLHTPTSERCDNKDNDCDGKVDEGFACKFNERRCNGTATVEICNSACTAFVKLRDCNINEGKVCKLSFCSFCGCAPGSRRCAGNDHYETCGQNGTTCRWGNRRQCAGNTKCTGKGVCQ